MNPAKSDAETEQESFPLTREPRCPFDPPPAGLTDRGFHDLKGKSAAIRVFGLDPE